MSLRLQKRLPDMRARIVIGILVFSMIPLVPSLAQTRSKAQKISGTINAADDVRVNVMPGYPNAPNVLPEQRHPTRPGEEMRLWGSVANESADYSGWTYRWEISDNPNVSVQSDGNLGGSILNARYIAERVTMNLVNGSTSEVVAATFTIADGSGNEWSDLVEIVIVSESDPSSDSPGEKLAIDMNIAIQRGLRFLHDNQRPDGSWSASGRYVRDNVLGGQDDFHAGTGFVLWALQTLGHSELNDPDEDVLAAGIRQGMSFILEDAVILPAISTPRALASLGARVEGVADQNGNGLCVRLVPSGNPNKAGYQVPFMAAALVAANSPNRIVESGPLAGWTYREVCEDVVDWLAGTMNLGSGSWGGRGGWTYEPMQHLGRSDMSINGAIIIFLEGAQDVLGVDVPDWMKLEIEHALYHHQAKENGQRDADSEWKKTGQFGYTDEFVSWFHYGLATTAAGLSGLVLSESIGPFASPGDVLSSYGPPLNTIPSMRQAGLEHLGKWFDVERPLSHYGEGNQQNAYVTWAVVRALRQTEKALGLPEGDAILLTSRAGKQFYWNTGYIPAEARYAAADEAEEGYYPYLLRTQNSNGSWNWLSGVDEFYSREFYTASSLLVLSKSVFPQPCLSGATVAVESLSPADGSTIASQTPFVLSGSTQSTSGAKVISVRVDGIPADAVDRGGRFFHLLTLSHGPHEIELVAEDQCAEVTQTITLIGEDTTAPDFDQYRDVSLQMEAQLSETTWNRDTETLHFEAQLCNAGEAAIRGPVLMVFTRLLPSQSFLQPDGILDDGRPFLALPQDTSESIIAPGECGPVRSVAIHNPGALAFDGDVLWLAPSNRAPVFQTIPVVEALVDSEYRHAVQAIDPDLDPVYYLLESGPGGMTVDPDSGLMAWTPSAGDVREHLVSIRALDPYDAAAIQSFTLSVEASRQNRPPYFTTSPIVIGEPGVPYEYLAAAKDPNGDTLTFTKQDGPAGLLVASDGRVSWDVPISGGFPVVLRVDDGQNGFAEQAWTLSIGGGGDNPNAPGLYGSPASLALVDELYLYQPTARDPDGDELTFALDLSPQDMSIDTQTGRVEWTPTAGQEGEHDVTLSVTDGTHSASQAWKIRVLPEATNRPPVILSTALLEGGIGQAYRYQVDAYDPDGDHLFYSLPAGPSGMTIDGFGLVSWTPDAVGTFEVAIEVRDSAGAVGAQVYDVFVIQPNRPPEIVTEARLQATERQRYFYNVHAVDPDRDPLRYELIQSPAGMTIDSVAGLIEWRPQAPDVGFHDITVQVVDGRSGQDLQSYQLEVLELNLPPEIDSSPPTTARAEIAFEYPAHATDPEQDVLTWRLTSAPAGMTIDSATGLVQWTPTAQQVGYKTVGIAVSDPRQNEDTQVFSVHVSGQNRPPEITSQPSQASLLPGSSFAYDVEATDPDGDPIRYTLEVQPPGMVIDEVSGLITWTPTLGDVGSHDVRVTAADDFGARDEQFFLVLVSEPPPDTFAPVVRLVATPESALVGESIHLRLLANDDVGITSRRIEVEGQTLPLDQSFEAVYSSAVAGRFEAVAIAQDAAGNVGQDRVTLSFADPSGSGELVAEITSPDSDPDVVHNAAFDVVGSAAGAGFLDYRVEIAPFDTMAWQILSESTAPVSDGPLARVQPFRCLNDLYTIRLTVRALDGSIARDSIVVDLHTGANAVGAYTVAYTDKSVSVGSIPLSVTRVYDSRRKDVGDFGIGWTLDLQSVEVVENRPMGDGWRQQVDSSGFFPFYYLEEQGKHRVVIRWGPNDVERFRPVPVPGSQTLYPMSGLDGVSFEAVGRVEGELFALDHPFFVNPPNPGEVSLADGGFRTWSPRQYLYEHPLGETLLFERKPGSTRRFRLKQITDPRGNWLTIGRDALFNSDNAGIVFHRDSLGRITRIVDEEGGEIRYEYDLRGRLAAMIDELGNRVTYHYDDNDQLVETRDPLGRPAIRQEYDASGLLIAMVDAYGNRFALDHDLAGNVELFTDSQGNVSEYHYDEDGNVTLERRTVTIDGVPQVYEASYAYDSEARETFKRDGDGVERETVYDAEGNVRVITVDPNGLALKTEMTYDAQGRLLTSIDPEGSVSSQEYDGLGNVIRRIDPESNVTTYDYDGAGRLIREADPRGVETHHYYTSDGLLARTEVVDQGQVLRVFELAYDRVGRRLAQIEYRTLEGQSRQLVTSYEYDEAGRVVAVTDPLGGKTRTEYDAAGQRVAIEDPLGRRTTFEYDDRGLLVRTVHPDGLDERTEYDEKGNTVATVDRVGRRTEYVLDEAGRVIETKIFDGAREIATVNVLSFEGRQIASIDVEGNRTDFDYDAAGRLYETTLPETYDALSGQRVRGVQTRGYDRANRLRSIQDPMGRVTQFTYDRLGRRRFTIFHDQSQEETRYDAVGNVTQRIDAEGRTTQYEYDALGRIARVLLPQVDGGTDHITEYTYDEAGNLLEAPRLSQRYDELGRVSRRILPQGQEETFTYDVAGRLIAHTDFMGQTETFEYNVMNRLVRHVLAGGKVRTFTYRPDGSLETAGNESGTVTQTYDSLGRLLTYQSVHGRQVDYTYTDRGQIDTMTTPGGVTDYDYDALGRMEAIASPLGNFSFERDLVGNPRRIARPQGVVTTYGYDNRHRPTFLEHRDASDQVLSAYTYTRDLTGLPLTLVEASGRQEVYGYDDQLRLRSVEVTDGGETKTDTYDWDRLDRTAATIDGVNHTYGYDANGQMTSIVSSQDGTTTQVFDDNGRLIEVRRGGQTIESYTWDGADRLTQHVGPAGTTTYAHDALNNMVGESTAAGTTDYLNGPPNATPYTQILSTFGPTGDEHFVYDGRGPLGSTTASDSTVFLRDLMRNIRQRVDGGAIRERAFDVFGTPEDQATNSHAYRGEWWDHRVAAYQLRARALNVSTGRFLSRDSMPISAGIPLNPYSYANSNPLVFEDPLGLFSLIELNVSANLRGNIQRAQSIGGFCRYALTAETLASFALTALSLIPIGLKATPEIRVLQWRIYSSSGRDSGLEVLASLQSKSIPNTPKSQQRPEFSVSARFVGKPHGRIQLNVGNIKVSGKLNPLEFDLEWPAGGTVEFKLFDIKSACGLSILKTSLELKPSSLHLNSIDTSKANSGERILTDLIKIKMEFGFIRSSFKPLEYFFSD